MTLGDNAQQHQTDGVDAGASSTDGDTATSNRSSPVPAAWHAQLAMLLWRHSQLNIIPDCHLLTEDEQYGVFLYLSRLADSPSK